MSFDGRAAAEVRGSSTTSCDLAETIACKRRAALGLLGSCHTRFMTGPHSAEDGSTGDASAEDASTAQVTVVIERRRLVWWWWPLTLAACLATFIVARTIPPWYPIGTWWGTFFTSAGFGGSLAVIGAVVASSVAFHNSRADRQQKASSDDLARWWDRFSWATEKAVSKVPSESVMGLTVLKQVMRTPWASSEDKVMALGVVDTIRANPPQAASQQSDAAQREAPKRRRGLFR